MSSEEPNKSEAMSVRIMLCLMDKGASVGN